jgi:signal transduction histidine kinase
VPEEVDAVGTAGTGDGERRPARRLRAPHGVRARSAIAAVLVVAVAMAGGTAVFVLVLQRTLISSVQRAATTRAGEVADQVRRDGPDDVQRLGTVREGQIVQVVDGRGRVVSSSSPRARDRPLATVRPADRQVRKITASTVPLLDDDDPYLLVVAGARSRGQLYSVVVATPIAAEQRSAQTSLTLLLVSVPVLLLLVGVATWWLVGRALGPVERIRARVAEIGGSQVSERIPVPASGDEIALLATTMNQMLQRLERTRRTQRRFVADASHELRSPLTTLAASLEVAAADRTNGSWRQLSPVMAAEVDRMGRLVQDLLLLAKADEHAIRLDLAEVDLDDLVGDGARRLRAHPRLRVDSSDVVPTRVVGDRDQLARVVNNLADNAAQHARTVVRVSLHQERDGALLVVEDDGPGVAPADRDRVFERFVRLDDSRQRAGGGSGLGLAIVQEVVHAHGGVVTLGESRSGGCRIEVRLAAAPPTAPPG